MKKIDMFEGLEYEKLDYEKLKDRIMRQITGNFSFKEVYFELFFANFILMDIFSYLKEFVKEINRNRKIRAVNDKFWKGKKVFICAKPHMGIRRKDEWKEGIIQEYEDFLNGLMNGDLIVRKESEEMYLKRWLKSQVVNNRIISEINKILLSPEDLIEELLGYITELEIYYNE
jgi:hypothetical protein